MHCNYLAHANIPFIALYRLASYVTETPEIVTPPRHRFGQLLSLFVTFQRFAVCFYVNRLRYRYFSFTIHLFWTYCTFNIYSRYSPRKMFSRLFALHLCRTYIFCGRFHTSIETRRTCFRLVSGVFILSSMTCLI